MHRSSDTDLRGRLDQLRILWDSGEYDQIIKEAHKIIREHPSGRAYNFLALAHKKKGDVGTAQKIYEELLEFNPDNTMFLSNLGNIYFDTGQLAAAERCLKKSLDIQPGQHNAAVSLANIYAVHRKYQAALQIFQNLKTDPAIEADQRSDLNYRIAELYRKQGAACYDDAIKYYRESQHPLSSGHLLECIYKTKPEEVFHIEKNRINQAGERNPLLAAVQTHASIRYGTADDNLFCKDPFNYIEHCQLGVGDGLDDALIAKILDASRGLDSQPQELLQNGRQTAGNLFLSDEPCIQEIKRIIEEKITVYRYKFAHSQDGFVTDWPKDALLYGWLICMSEGGSLSSHMHKQGWISGSLYLEIPNDKKNNQGNIVFELCGDDYPATNGKLPSREVNVRRGDLVMFPSSIFHRTLPTKSQTSRVSLAFDLKPSVQ